MELMILYDNTAPCGLSAAHGFACLIDGRILFDTGGKLDILMGNMRRLGVNVKKIDTVIISHDHWDHRGGIEVVREMNRARVFVPASSSDKFRKSLDGYTGVDVIPVKEPMMIEENIWSTGEMGDKIREQSVIINSSDGLSVITGCAHPGLPRIINRSSNFGKVRKVVGGFHDFDRLETLDNMILVVPCHCTRLKEEIIRRYPSRARRCRVGLVLEV